MKKFLVSAFVMLAFWANAQTIVPNSPTVPAGFAYQAVARQASGAAYVNTALTVQFTVLQGSAAGASQWVETHAVTTNANGLFTTVVGTGTRAQGSLDTSFSQIDWSKGPYFLKVDLVNGASTTTISTTQLLSVPYAQVAGKAPWTDYAIFLDTTFSTVNLTNGVERTLNKTQAISGNSISRPSNGNSILLKQGTYYIKFNTSYQHGGKNIQALLRELGTTTTTPPLIVGTNVFIVLNAGGVGLSTSSLGEGIVKVTNPSGIQVHLVEYTDSPSSIPYSNPGASATTWYNNAQIFIQKID